jgi:hypothetical protein
MTTSASELSAPPATQSSSAWPLKSWQELPILFFVPFLINIQSLGFDLLYVDDFTYFKHPSLHEGKLAGLADIWRTTILSDYSPVTQLTVWLDVALFGTNHWWGARLHEIAWFSIGVLALYAIAIRLTKRRDLAFFTALLYALHPVCAQSNLWLAERKNLVALALSLWALERYIVARQRETFREALPPALAAFFITAAAMLSKPHAVAIVAMMASYEMSLGSGPLWKRVAWTIPFGVVCLGFVYASLKMVRTDLNRELLGGSVATAALGDGPILLRYLQNTIFPTRLTLYYAVDEPTLRSLSHYAAWVGVLAIVALSVFAARQRALVLFCWMFALAGLGPALNLVPQLAPMTDHYHQWALPGLLLALVVLTHDRLQFRADVPAHRGGVLLVGGLALFWGILSFARVPEFTSYVTFFAAAALKEPDSAMNWGIFCNALRAHSEAKTKEEEQKALDTMGFAGRRALQCKDAKRLIDAVRIVAIQEAARDLHAHGRGTEAWALATRECKVLVDPHESRNIQAEIALRMNMTKEALALLTQDWNALCQQVAAALRKECREGKTLPHEFPPQVLFSEGGGGDEDTERAKELTRNGFLLLVDAYVMSKDLEKAWDVAAVIENFDPDNIAARKKLAEIYLRLKVDGVLERLVPKRAE